MPARFLPGSTVYAKDGRSYVVEDYDDGIVYCTASNGVETEFPEDKLLTQAEWEARAHPGVQHDVSYLRIKQSRHYLSQGEKFDTASADRVLQKADRLSPGIIDFTAFSVAERVLLEHREEGLVEKLSVRKCRDVFDAASSPIRARLLAELLGARADALVNAGGVGDNLLKAMIDKGLEPLSAAYDEFQDRPRH